MKQAKFPHRDSSIIEKDACGVGFVYRPNASNLVIKDALTALTRMEHRGACSADGITGDGAGILTALPGKLFQSEGYRGRAVGMVFLPEDPYCRQETERILHSEDFLVKGWRQVPVNKNVLGPMALATCPRIEQIFVDAPETWSDDELEKKLFLVRKRITADLASQGDKTADFYIASLSSKTIVYKGMLRSYDLERFYLDLASPLFESKFAVYHRRFSTNTMPKWRLAQPFRLLAHNGEINTLLGNLNWMLCRERALVNKYIGADYSFVSSDTSDSANLDNVLELLVRFGRSPESGLMQLIPDACKTDFSANASSEYDKSQLTGFYRYFSAIQEPWDGPALVVFSDGKSVGAKLDRNGLRPARFTRLRDGSVFLSSECGIVDLDPAEIVQQGRLGPGQLISIDIESGTVREDLAAKIEAAAEAPYLDWVQAERLEFKPISFSEEPADEAACGDSEQMLSLHTAHGFGKEDISQILPAMARTAHEAVYSMGDDTPLAVLSSQARLLYDYFKQRFAQVTNPPIDHLREHLVMSLDTYLGKKSGWLSPDRAGARAIHLQSPILSDAELAKLKTLNSADGELAATLSLLYSPAKQNLDKALDNLCAQAADSVFEGKALLVLSDRVVTDKLASIPPLLAVAAVHHELIRRGLRLECSLIVDTAQAWTSHHFACLFGYGAQAVCPYLAFETVRTHGQSAQANYKTAVEEGLMKVLSKMGITSLTSYIGAQIFECIGLADSVVERCFTGTPSRIAGLTIDEIELDLLELHRQAFPAAVKLFNYGLLNFRPGGEYHGNNPRIVRSLHTALGLNSKAANDSERQDSFLEYSALVRERPALALRDILAFNSDRSPVALDQVEPADEIVKRFCTGGMSLGALSKEAHEVLAIAMNRLGAKSNSGEGGEDPQRYYPIGDIDESGRSASFPRLTGLRPGDSASSAVRQVASARFGVTPEYLVTAEQLEIKIAQGAKPGEGGQLPGEKVSPYIAKLRRAKPGMALISPPPHHDIYSIEDLAQLIFDLRQVNESAKISVKLVAEIGIGAVAVGVAKADADIIQVSGNDGGTGASAVSSIKHAGVPWELGLVEVHRALLENGMRSRVRLRVDGGLKSGWEVVMAAILGAEEYGFGSIALIAGGCIMARICHTNNCPVGITSQKEKLRERFVGVPDQIVEFFLYVAEEVRLTLAKLGFRSLEEVIGRSELLTQAGKPVTTDCAALDSTIEQNDKVNLDYLLSKASSIANVSTREKHTGLTDYILDQVDIVRAINNHSEVTRTYPITNTDRAVGARLGGRLAKLYGDHGFKGNIALHFSGSAGQSFGAFIVDNVSLSLTGEANDYVGKGMSGGEITIRFPQQAKLESWKNVIAGNTCLYGATGGSFFGAGQVGERFAVRNSGATAVIEGAGDHCCEYMTGGVVVVLGSVGRNFAAGMTGGLAFVLDTEASFAESRYCGESDKKLQRVTGKSEQLLWQLLQQHHKATESARALQILADWSNYLPDFWQVVPTGEDDNQLFDDMPQTETFRLTGTEGE